VEDKLRCHNAAVEIRTPGPEIRSRALALGGVIDPCQLEREPTFLEELNSTTEAGTMVEERRITRRVGASSQEGGFSPSEFRPRKENDHRP
jgi:hypothetical protein